MIFEGRLKQGDIFQVSQLAMEDIDQILQLQNEVYDALESKAQLARLTKEEYEYILSGKGLVLGVFIKKELIAIRALLVPEIDDPEHLGLDVGLSREQLLEVIYQEISFVH